MPLWLIRGNSSVVARDLAQRNRGWAVPDVAAALHPGYGPGTATTLAPVRFAQLRAFATLMFSNFTPRMILILIHDLVAAVVAVLAAFYIRFEAPGLAERWALLLLLLPGFVLYAAVVYSVFGLFKNKWRFTSLPDVMNIAKVATVLALTLLALDYVLLAPNFYGTFF